MTLVQYNETKDRLYDIWCLNPPEEQIVKYVNRMYELLCYEWGFLCKPEIIIKMVNDMSSLGLSRSRINQLLPLDEN